MSFELETEFTEAHLIGRDLVREFKTPLGWFLQRRAHPRMMSSLRHQISAVGGRISKATWKNDNRASRGPIQTPTLRNDRKRHRKCFAIVNHISFGQLDQFIIILMAVLNQCRFELLISRSDENKQ